MGQPHSRVSASSCERWWNCPGSVQEAAKYPQITSEYAREGTAAHKLAEMCLDGVLTPFEAIGTEVCGVTITEAMAEAVHVYLDVIDEDLAKYKLTRRDLQIERKFHLAHIHPDAYGTNDANLPVFLTKVIVYDFKYGSGIAVDAEDNKQGLYYALGAAKEGDYTEIEVVIVQPRAIHKEGPVRRWTVPMDDLVAFAKELRKHIEATEGAKAPLVCGEWCKKTFCPALVGCKEARKAMEKAALVAFDGPADVVVPKPESLSLGQIQRLLSMAPIIDAYLKSVESYALEVVNRGEKIPGFKLVAKRSNRKWKDEDAVVKKFGKTAIRVIEEVLSPSQLETELKKAMPLKEAKGAVEPLTFKPDTGTVLVPESDPRDEARPKLEQVFGNEELFG